MNILFLLGKFPSIGGVETVTAILANEFSARGHAVHVVSFEQVTEKPSPALDERVTLHRLSYPRFQPGQPECPTEPPGHQPH